MVLGTKGRVPTAYLQQLKERGILTKMYRYGLISHKAAMMLEVRMKVDALMRQGQSKEESIRNVIATTRLSRATIYRYL